MTLRDTLPAYRHLEGVEVRVAVTSGLAGADRLMREIAKGQSPYHFIEVMGCPGGCVSGGGQPRTDVENFRELRSRALYAEDEGKPLRKSHENPDLLRLYETWMGRGGRSSGARAASYALRAKGGCTTNGCHDGAGYPTSRGLRGAAPFRSKQRDQAQEVRP